MALSMHEQQVLAEMERKLTAEDPVLASRLATFGSPALAAVLRSRRARAVFSLILLAALAVAILAVFALHPLR